jgi:hypothetical protein
MKKTKNQAVTTIALTTIFSALALVSAMGQSNVSVFATGLNKPDGNLYVAEGGIGGTNSTEALLQPAFTLDSPASRKISGGASIHNSTSF